MNRSVCRALWASALLPASLHAGSAAAQSPATELGELVVTAQKRSESVQEVPAAITALAGEALQARGVTTPQDLQFLTPSMQAGRMLGQTAIAIRGVGLNQGAPGVAIHVDGVYQPQAAMGDLAQIDIERVEILRGPQGTLYGRNANGGVINFITKAPTQEVEGYVLGSYATFQESRLQGVINAPLSERVRARLVLDRWERAEGFVKNVLPSGQDLDAGEELSGRLRVAVDIAPDWTLDLSATALHASGPSNYFTLNSPPSAAAVAANPYLAAAVVPVRPRRTSANDPVDSDRRYSAGSAVLSGDLGPLQVRSITGYQWLKDKRRGDGDAISVSAFPSRTFARSETFTQELNVSGEAGPLSAVVGGFYMRDHRSDRVVFDFTLGLAPLPPNSRSTFEAPRYLTKTYGLFADATVELNDRARVIAGLRYSEDQIALSQQAELNFGGVLALPACPFQTNEVTFRSTTPRVGVQFDLSGESNLYATYSQGFKAGGFNLYACNNQFRPEKVKSYELGWKNSLLERRLTLNAAAFHYNYSDLQLLQLVGFTAQITNAAEARIRGVELEAIWRPDDHWALNGSLSLLDAKFREFVNIDSLAPQLGAQDLKGNRLADAPKVSANLGVQYRTDPVLAGGRFTVRTDLSYRSRTYFREFNTRLDSQKPYALVNAALIWDSADEAYRVRIFANNLFDQDRVTRMVSSDSFGARAVTWGAPRQVGVELTANF